MNDLFTEYREFLSDNFKGISLQKPLFYHGNYGLRFDLQNEHITTEDTYFKEIVNRVVTIF